MKKLVTYLSIFGAGCALGVLGTKTYFERKYKDIAEEEIESVKEVFKRKTIALEGAEKKEEIVSDIVGNVKGVQPVGAGLFMDMTPEHMKDMQIKYNKVSDDFKEESPIEGDYKPYLIDIDDFDATGDGYSKHQYAYYIDDATLVSDEDEVINSSDIVGLDTLELFENLEDEVCYVRNEARKEDYEITKVFSSYSEVVGDEY